MINMIAAVSQNNVIGINNTIPWYCSADFQYFKKTTMNNVLIMGRKTYQSLFDHMKDKSKEPLPGRIKIVITTEPKKIEIRPNVFPKNMFLSAGGFLENLQKQFPNKNIFVIGGEQIYKLFDGCYTNIFLTRIDGNFISQNISEEDVIHYLPIKDSVLLRDYELLYTDIVENDVDTQTTVRYEQWRVRNSYGT